MCSLAAAAAAATRLQSSFQCWSAPAGRRQLPRPWGWFGSTTAVQWVGRGGTHARTHSGDGCPWLATNCNAPLLPVQPAPLPSQSPALQSPSCSSSHSHSQPSPPSPPHLLESPPQNLQHRHHAHEPHDANGARRVAGGAVALCPNSLGEPGDGKEEGDGGKNVQGHSQPNDLGPAKGGGNAEVGRAGWEGGREGGWFSGGTAMAAMHWPGQAGQGSSRAQLCIPALGQAGVPTCR